MCSLHLLFVCIIHQTLTFDLNAILFCFLLFSVCSVHLLFVCIIHQVGNEVVELWKVDSKDVNMSTPFTTEELVEALKSMKAGKAPGPEYPPRVLLHAGDAATESLCLPVLERCEVPKIWRKATVIALPKPNKPKDDPKSYRPISLLCIPFRRLERMILDVSTTSLIPSYLRSKLASVKDDQS